MIDKLIKNNTIFRGLACVFAVILVVMILAANMLEANRTMVDSTLLTKSNILVTENVESLFTAFPPDDDFLTGGKLDTNKYKKLFSDIYTQMQAEGSVLLKNDNNTLPLTGAGKKVTLLGRRSYTDRINASIASAGFKVNPTTQTAYLGVAGDKPGTGTEEQTGLKPLMNPPLRRNAAYAQYDALEGSVDWLKGRSGAALNTSFAEYNDAAIVTIGRNSAEGPDYEASPNGVTASSGARNPMGLSTNEKDIINLACENFDKVIILVRAVNMMELGDLKDNPKVGAILWVGQPRNGAPGIGQIISGAVNPSGGLYSMYARNSLSAPAIQNVNSFYFTNWMDFGEGIANVEKDSIPGGPNYPGNPTNPSPFYPDAKPIKPSDKKGGRVDTPSASTRGTDPGLENYLIEAENIYVGYRYYETRYNDSVNGDEKAKSKVGAFDSKDGWNYDEEVAYGFGYGLSYTTFKMTMGTPTFDKVTNIASVPVTVKNTGNIKGKASVQLYAQSPYTAYDKTNLVEKSAVQLVAFEKSKMLEPNATEIVTVKVDLQNLASYDYKKAKTFIMDISDDYYFAVGNGAHDALNNILTAQGKTTESGMTYKGDADAVQKWSHVQPKGSTGEVDAVTFSVSKTGEKITNQLPYSSYDYYEKGIVTELSRQDWSGTFPKPYKDLTANKTLMDHYNGNYIEVKTKDSVNKDKQNDVVWDKDNKLRFGDMIKADYDDERWDDLLDQLTIEEAIQGALQGGRGFADMPSIGFPTGRYAENGAGNPKWLDTSSSEPQAPWKIAKPADSATVTSGNWPELSIIASTFNPDISYEWGRLLGNAAIFSETFIIWQPGANTHRTAYNGRMFLYYSEDPVLTGVHTMEMAMGALPKGGIVSAKHMAFNDQEMHRAGVGVFLTEQRAREIELRAFQIPFESNKYDTKATGNTKAKDVGMLGTMTAFNKIGGVECTTSKGMLTNILRKEWGNNGYVVSDLKDDLDLARQGIKAGMTGYDWRAFADDIEPWDDTKDWSYDKELMESMKVAIRRNLYMFANSSLMNSVNASTYTKWNMTWWRAVYIVGITLSSVFLAASASMFVVLEILKKKKGGI